MNLRLVLVCAALAAPQAFGQKKETVELQRDVALLQDQVRTMQRTLDEKLAALTALVQQSVDAGNKANTSVAVLQSGMAEKMNEQAKNVVAPVANLGLKVDQMGDEIRNVRESVTDMNSRLGKFDQRLKDIVEAIKVVQARPAPPPAADGTQSPAADGNAPPPGMSATTLFDNAKRDYSGGNRDLAIQGFTEYLKYYHDTELAAEAQFLIGYAQYLKSDYSTAAKSFDAVVEQFPEGTKTTEALYMKGVALEKDGQRTAAADEYRNVIKRYANSEWAKKATANLKRMGLTTGTPTPGRRRK